MPTVYYTLISGWLGGLLFLQAQPQRKTETPNQADTVIVTEKPRVSARLLDERLESVCQTITETTQVPIVLANGLGDDLVSLNLDSAPVDAVLRDLFAGYDMFVLYGGGSNTQPPGLRAVWVYRKGDSSDVQPARRSEWASTRELEAALIDGDGATREAAYQALLDRPDRSSRSVISDAIRGVRESDSGLRERLLSTAMGKGYYLAPDLLADLARFDASEQIRWMALDALSQSMAVKDVAEAAMSDSSEAVRSRAADILRQLSGDKQ